MTAPVPGAPPIRRRLMSKFLLAGIAAILAIALAEVSLRVHRHAVRRAVVAKYSQGDGRLVVEPSEIPGLVYACAPNTAGTNSRGYYDVEHEQAKPPDVFRVVVIGDSIVAGHGIHWRKSFPRLLEDCLNRRPLDRNVEVISLACSGYSTSQELVLLRREAFEYDPDLILWSYVLNDPADPLYDDANGDLRLLYEPTCHLGHLMGQAWYRLGEMIRCCGGPREYHRRLHLAHWDEVQRNFAEIAQAGRDHKVPIVLLIHPVLEAKQTVESYSLVDLSGSLACLATREGLVPLDLCPAYRGCSFDDLLFPDDPWHPNGLGHRLLAEYLDRWLFETWGKLPRQPVTGRRGLAHFSAIWTLRPPQMSMAEKCACPLTAEGDSPIFTAKQVLLVGNARAAVKIGTVPVTGYLPRSNRPGAAP